MIAPNYITKRNILWHINPLLGNDRDTNETAIAMKQLRKYSTVLEPLLDSGPCTTMEVLLEAVLLRGYITSPTSLSSVTLQVWEASNLR
jgi:hypothetical protein